MDKKIEKSLGVVTVLNVMALVRKIENLECYCEALESKLTPKKISEATNEASKKWVAMKDIKEYL